jgi:hypothetical protein
MNQFEKSLEASLFLKPSVPWGEKELSENKRLGRLRLAQDFWRFDRLYFSNDAYSDGHSLPCNYHKFIYSRFFVPGVSVLLGPRKHGKTAYAKKICAWLLLTGKIRFLAVSSETLPTSRNILKDIISIIGENDRILFDFKPVITEKNADEFTFSVPGQKGFRHGMAFSEGRSVRGASRLFSRPDIILIDDLETRQSPLGDSQTDRRIRIIDESYQSLSKNGSAVVLGNNFDERCAYNRLKLLSENNLLEPHWNIFSHPAWLLKGFKIGSFNFQKGPLWKIRFPAESVSGIKKLLKVYDESAWLGDFQQVPAPPDGDLFKRGHFNTFSIDSLPKDARGIVYCDPNLSKKSKGDSTCIIAVVFSPSANNFYVLNSICRSYSGSNELLNDVLRLRFSSPRLIGLGFDGNVAQESSWTNNVRNWCSIHKAAFPLIEYKRYRVDDLAKNAQIIYEQKRILFLDSFSNSEDGSRFKSQLFSFSGKKANNPDDAPDALICAIEFLSERGLARPGSALNMPLLTSF